MAKLTNRELYSGTNPGGLNVALDILGYLEELGTDEIYHYYSSFPEEIDYNLVQYGEMRVYYSDIRKMYIEAGRTEAENWSDTKLWYEYKRSVGGIAKRLLKKEGRI